MKKKIMWQLRRLKMKDNFFVVLIILFTFLIYLYGKGGMGKFHQDDIKNNLVELDEHSFYDHISSGISFVLFYLPDSESSEKEMSNLSYLARKETGNISFFKINMEKYSKHCSHYGLSGVPSIIIFNRGKEEARILGVVSRRNFDMIYNRYAKL